jgi:hypothetical protein
MDSKQQIKWPDLSKDQRAIELAKTAMGWNEMTSEQQMDASRYLIKLADEFKDVL